MVSKFEIDDLNHYDNDGNGDQVLAEADIFVLSPTAQSSFTENEATRLSTAVNRIQFHNHEAASSLLQQHLDRSVSTCSSETDIHFKANVNRLRFSRVIEKDGVDNNSSRRSLKKKSAEVGEEAKQQIVYQADGYSAGGGLVNNAVGFFIDGRLFLVPIAYIYDLQYLVGGSELETGKMDGIENGETPLIAEGTKTNATERGIKTELVRVKFARQETEAKKKRREQSAQHKQKLIDADPWVPLNIEAKRPDELYSRDVHAALATLSPRKRSNCDTIADNVCSATLRKPQIKIERRTIFDEDNDKTVDID